MSVGLNSRQCENLARQPAVSCQFSPLISWMTAEPVQESKVGMTRPTPLPLLVGAKARTWINPWMVGRAEVVRSHYPAQRVRGALLRIGEEGRNAGERLLLLGVEHMQ